jgi:hypothetical protein
VSCELPYDLLPPMGMVKIVELASSNLTEGAIVPECSGVLVDNSAPKWAAAGVSSGVSWILDSVR